MEFVLMRLGVIADDFTGAVDIAGFLVEGGMRTMMCSRAVDTQNLGPVDAIVMSLKIRSLPARQAVDEALKALDFLQSAGCDRFYYKYCSTFDSTKDGNIGPVTDALRKALGEKMTLICPALPVNGRTVFHGYLFVNHDLLSDSAMRHHPLNPMLDAKLERLLLMQNPSKCGHIFYDTVSQGIGAVKQKREALEAQGVENLIVDVIDDEDLVTIAEATKDLRLVTGGSGLAMGLAKVRAQERGCEIKNEAAFLPKRRKAVVLAGSCSAMMQKQVAYYRSLAPSLSLDEVSCVHDPDYSERVAEWVLDHQHLELAPMVYATRSVEQLEENRKRFADVDLAKIIEQSFGTLTKLLARAGTQTFIVGGGETSGMVATTLGVDAYLIGPQIDPGVSWVQSLDGVYELVFKSGNFGSVEFLRKAQHEYM